jgi:sugar transferase (PEP-CTERM system associated)
MIRLFRVFIPASELALFVSEVLLIVASFVLAAFFALDFDPVVYLLYDGGMLRISLVAISIVLGMHFLDLYTKVKVKERILLAQQLCLVAGIAFLAQGLVSYVDPELMLPRQMMMWGTALTMGLIFVWRLVYSAFVLRVIGAQRILFVGANPVVAEITEELRGRPNIGLEVAGVLDDARPEGEALNGAQVLGPISSLREVAGALKPDRIVVGLSERRDRMPVNDLLELRFSGYVIEEAAATYEVVCGRICTKELRPAQLIFSGEMGPRPGSIFYQSVMNTVIALAALIVLSPILLLAALAVKISSPGPVLYRQRRVGLDGETFTVYKFRSMFVDAEKATGAVWAQKDDPRVTPVGRVLRRYRLDEFPQLINVLRGDMSIVGPRPERPEFVRTLSEQIPYYRQRHCVKPGITGWAQINYKYGETVEDTIRKLEYDLYYIKHMSFSLDTYIIFHTLKTMLLSRGSQ